MGGFINLALLVWMMHRRMNAKERKHLIAWMTERYGPPLGEWSDLFFQNPKGRVFLLTPVFSRLPTQDLRVNALGLYLGRLDAGGIRLSIEGAQMVGSWAVKNVVELSADETRQWMNGEDLENKDGLEGPVLVRHGKDFYGSGRASGERLLNFVPKERRIKRQL